MIVLASDSSTLCSERKSNKCDSKNPFSEFLIVLFNFLSILGRGRADLKLKGEMKNENYTKEREENKTLYSTKNKNK
jgi:hypothetical protein